MPVIKNEVCKAQKRISAYVRRTPLEYAVALSKLTNSQVYLKCETSQYTGAFKVRGAFNTILQLSEQQRQQGIVTASSGNHGAAVAFASQQLHIPSLIFLPENAATAKISNIKNYDAKLEFYGIDCVETEKHALEYAKSHKLHYISPYNDLQIIAGQGTIAAELVEQLDKIDVVLVPIGGGGLISGIAGYLKAVSPKTQIIGCLPENSPVMAESIKAGHIVEMPVKSTLSDATAGGIEPGAMTFEFCKQFVDDYITVSEQQIKQAIIALIEKQHILAEGSSGVAVAALIKNQQDFSGKNVIVVLSGANISVDTLRSVLD